MCEEGVVNKTSLRCQRQRRRDLTAQRNLGARRPIWLLKKTDEGSMYGEGVVKKTPTPSVMVTTPLDTAQSICGGLVSNTVVQVS
jgi:hypothetical protein